MRNFQFSIFETLFVSKNPLKTLVPTRRGERISAKSVPVNANPARNSICIQRRRKLVHFVIGFSIRFILPRAVRSARVYHRLPRYAVYRLGEKAREEGGGDDYGGARKEIGPRLIDPKVDISAKDSSGRMGSFSV